MALDIKYTTEARARGGGRNGLAALRTGMLTLTMQSPKELGGSGAGHNPEELFALGYAACYLGALRFACRNEGLDTLPDDGSVDAEVSIGTRDDGGFGIKVKLVVRMPGVEKEMAEKIAERAHFVCPYSHATNGNIEVETVIA